MSLQRYVAEGLLRRHRSSPKEIRDLFEIGPAVDKLLGAVSQFGAKEGLFISWGGYNANVPREMATSFFKVRLWTQKDLLESLFANYDKLDGDLKAELPLKRIWTVAAQEEQQVKQQKKPPAASATGGLKLSAV